MGKGEGECRGRIDETVRGRPTGDLPVKVHARTSRVLVDDLDVSPAHIVSQPGAECLQYRLFGCEARCHVFIAPPLSRTIGLFPFGEQGWKDFWIFSHESFHAVNPNQVNADPDA
jgi:hypothetical protein